MKIWIIRCFFRETCVFDFKAIMRKLHIPMFYREYENIEKLKDCQKGKRCFIVATGPSLCIEDIELIKHEVTIGVNGIYNTYSKTDWRPTYYLCGDFAWYRDHRNIFRHPELLGREKVIVNDTIRKDIEENEKQRSNHIIGIPVSQFNIFFRYNKKLFRFSRDLLWGLYTANTITNVAICIAAYMGIREIYLLGVDCNYSGEQKHYGVKDDYKIDEERAKQIEQKMQLGYRLVAEKCNKRKIKVYNATRGGSLEVFERVNLEDVIL